MQTPADAVSTYPEGSHNAKSSRKRQYRSAGDLVFRLTDTLWAPTIPLEQEELFGYKNRLEVYELATATLVGKTRRWFGPHITLTFDYMAMWNKGIRLYSNPTHAKIPRDHCLPLSAISTLPEGWKAILARVTPELLINQLIEEKYNLIVQNKNNYRISPDNLSDLFSYSLLAKLKAAIKDLTTPVCSDILNKYPIGLVSGFIYNKA